MTSEAKKELLKEVGTRVHEARKRKGWTLEYLAEQVGLSVPSIRHIENGQRACGIDSFAAIVLALDESADHLLDIDNHASKTRITKLSEQLTDEDRKIVERIILAFL